MVSKKWVLVFVVLALLCAAVCVAADEEASDFDDQEKGTPDEPWGTNYKDWLQPNAPHYPFMTIAKANRNKACPGQRQLASATLRLRIKYGLDQIQFALYNWAQWDLPKCPIDTSGGECAIENAFELNTVIVGEGTLEKEAGVCHSYTAPYDYMTTAGANLEGMVNMWSVYRKLTMQQHIHDDVDTNSGLLGYQLGLGEKGYVTPYDLLVADLDTGNMAGFLQLDKDQKPEFFLKFQNTTSTDYKMLVNTYEATYPRNRAVDTSLDNTLSIMSLSAK